MTETVPIRLTGVSLAFGRGADRLDVLDGMDLEVGRREVVALIGPNGCGKSTLLRVVAGLLPADRGDVRLDGAPVAGPDPRVALVFQEPRLLPWASAAANVAFPLELAGRDRATSAARVDELLRLVGLRDFADARPGELSGGMRQRVAIARALALEPAVLLLDEPFSALDALTRDRFDLELLRLWDRTGTAILVVTHSIPEAVLLADRVVVMTPRPGRVAGVVAVGLERPRRLEMLESPALARAAAEVRRLLVDTTDDERVLAEAAVRRPVAAGGAVAPTTAADSVAPGEPAWFDPFAGEERR
ncbi:MAG: hypothetical protein RL338_1820 [Chloroflexota bacterium]|jgi:NitT/TauT family transport system ATP-binding protein